MVSDNAHSVQCHKRPVIDHLVPCYLNRGEYSRYKWPRLSHSMRKAIPHTEKPQGAQSGGKDGPKKVQKMQDQQERLQNMFRTVLSWSLHLRCTSLLSSSFNLCLFHR